METHEVEKVDGGTRSATGDRIRRTGAAGLRAREEVPRAARIRWRAALLLVGAAIGVALPVQGQELRTGRSLLLRSGPAPTGLTAVAAGPMTVDLRWGDPGQPVTGYVVLRAGSDGVFASLTPTPVGQTSYQDATAPEGSTLHYKVAAQYARMAPGETSPVTVTTPTRTELRRASGQLVGVAVPDPGQFGVITQMGPPPTGVSARALGPTSVELRWTLPAGATGSQIYRGWGTTKPVLLTPAPVGGASWTDTGVAPEMTFKYWVTSVFGNGPGGTSADVTVTTPPDPPTGLTARVTAPGTVRLAWNPVAGAARYLVASHTAAHTATVAAPTHTLQGLAPGTYAFGVLAQYDVAGFGVAETVAARAPRVQVTIHRPIVGFADLHAHTHSNEGFGGRLVWGAPYGPPDQALAWDPPHVHGLGGVSDLFGHALRVIGGHPAVDPALPGHLVGGWPQFDGWPRYDIYTHQQFYADWLKRAVDGGLRLMVMYAVNAEGVCQVVGPLPGRSCNDMDAVDRQIAAARAMESWIDARSGGPGRGWYRIVTDASQARAVMESGRIAVVLGIEVQNLFNCQQGRPCDAAHVRSELARYHAMGVRQIIPIHNTNNLFGGSALYNDVFNANNWKLTGSFFTARSCSTEGVEFRLGSLSGAVQGLLAYLFPGVSLPGGYPPGGNCNEQGLTPLGRFLVQEMMHRRMIIDIDHSSYRSIDEILGLARTWRYPLVASHTGLITTSIGAKRSEGQKTDAHLSELHALGGVVAPILYQGRTNEIRTLSRIPHDCGNSTKSWAQAYLYTASRMPGSGVALGSDLGGMVAGTAPRFGPSACDGDRTAPQTNPVSYPFVARTGVSLGQHGFGQRQFDINVDGLAHIGLLPDMVEDLRRIGLTDADLDPLFRSAESYVNMWDAIERTNVPAPTS